MQIGDPIPGYYVGMPFNGYPGHRGADFPAPSGTPILAAHDGRVRMAGWYGGDYQPGGNLVYLTAHDNSYETSYQHMVSAPIVSVGQDVAAEQVIGYVGSTGYSTGPHLHFELWLGGLAWQGGTAVDPAPYINTTPQPTQEDEDIMLTMWRNNATGLVIAGSLHTGYSWNLPNPQYIILMRERGMVKNQDPIGLAPNEWDFLQSLLAEARANVRTTTTGNITASVDNAAIAKAVNDEMSKRLQA